jgi:hypothetical protein
MAARVEFCGEVFELPEDRPWFLGRSGDLVIDDNPFLHRQFLGLGRDAGLWWLSNVGSQLAATLSDPEGLLQAWLSPGARIPVTMPRTVVRFTAGSTSYDLDILLDDPPYDAVASTDPLRGEVETTTGRVSFTRDQLLLVLVLAEPRLRAEGREPSVLPTTPSAAERLAWTEKKFERKLDNVCDKLANLGVRGLRGDAGRLAANRRARLVEYAVGARLVTRSDLSALPPVVVPLSSDAPAAVREVDAR